MVHYQFAKHDSSNLEGHLFKICLLLSQMVIILGNYLNTLSLLSASIGMWKNQ